MILAGSYEHNFSNSVTVGRGAWKFKTSSGFEPVTSLKTWIFRLLYRLHAIAKIAFIKARIIASLDFISAVQYMIHFLYHFIRWLLFTCFLLLPRALYFGLKLILTLSVFLLCIFSELNWIKWSRSFSCDWRTHAKNPSLFNLFVMGFTFPSQLVVKRDVARQ